MRILPIFLVILVFLPGCSRTQPVYNVTDHSLPAAAQKLSLEQIGDAIVAGPKAPGWSLTKVNEGVIDGEYKNRHHFAEVVVKYNNKNYSIVYSGSRNLLSDGTEVHKAYNKWVKQLDDDIWQSIASAAAKLEIAS